MHCRVSPLSYTTNTKLFCLKLGLYSFTKFFYYNQKDLWLVPFLQVKVSVVNSAGGSFCWNYASDTFCSNYAGANVCCSYAGFKVLLQLCWWYILLQLCWWIFLLQLHRWLFLLQLCSSKFLQHLCRWKVFAANMWVTIFIEIM